jgi:hypothetical protein
VVADVLQADGHLAADAVEAAGKAFPAWPAMPAPARGEQWCFCFGELLQCPECVRVPPLIVSSGRTPSDDSIS